MTTTLAIIAAAVAVTGAIIRFTALAVSVVRAWSADVADLRADIAAVRVDLANNNSAIRTECWDMIQDESKILREALEQHRRDCQATRNALEVGS